MTSLYRSDIIGSALTAGAVACLEKPIDPREVLALISKPKGRPKPTNRACPIIGCARPSRSRAYCAGHYQKRRSLELKHRRPETWIDYAAPQSLKDVVPRRWPIGASALRASSP